MTIRANTESPANFVFLVIVILIVPAAALVVCSQRRDNAATAEAEAQRLVAWQQWDELTDEGIALADDLAVPDMPADDATEFRTLVLAMHRARVQPQAGDIVTISVAGTSENEVVRRWAIMAAGEVLRCQVNDLDHSDVDQLTQVIQDGLDSGIERLRKCAQRSGSQAKKQDPAGGG